MAIKFSDYDLFTVGENWYLVKDEEFIVGADDETVIFKEGANVEIVDIIKEGGYGQASIKIEDYSFIIGLDELYDMVWE
jgi:hypothetical protein